MKKEQNKCINLEVSILISDRSLLIGVISQLILAEVLAFFPTILLIKKKGCDLQLSTQRSYIII